jgi:hypothetical protein
MIPFSRRYDQTTLLHMMEDDPVVVDARAFFSFFDWSIVERWQAQRSSRGRPGHPERAYLKAFLLRIKKGLIYTEQLRCYLLEHPLLIIELGFRLHLDPTATYGFDVERTLPSRFWRGRETAPPRPGTPARPAGRNDSCLKGGDCWPG